MKDTARAAAKLGVRHRRRLHRLVDLAHAGDVPAGAAGDDRARVRRTSPTGGTRSSTSSTRSACGSRTRCTRARSRTTTGPPSARWRRSATGRRSGSTGTRRTSCGRTSTRSNFILDFADRIYHVDCKDAKVRTGDGRRGRLSSHLPWADLRRGWDFVSTGHGDVPWEDCFRALNAIGYDGPISIEWEDAGMDRLVGAPEALAVRPPARLRRRRRPPSTPRSPARTDGRASASWSRGHGADASPSVTCCQIDDPIAGQVGGHGGDCHGLAVERGDGIDGHLAIERRSNSPVGSPTSATWAARSR